MSPCVEGKDSFICIMRVNGKHRRIDSSCSGCCMPACMPFVFQYALIYLCVFMYVNLSPCMYVYMHGWMGRILWLHVHSQLAIYSCMYLLIYRSICLCMAGFTYAWSSQNQITSFVNRFGVAFYPIPSMWRPILISKILAPSKHAYLHIYKHVHTDT